MGKKVFTSTYQPPEKWTEEKALQLGNELINWLKEKDKDGNDKGNVFFEEFLVIEKDLYPELIKYLGDKFTSFFKLIEQAKKIQEIKLMKLGVLNNLNASITKFVLINKHDWKDKHEVAGKDRADIVPITGMIVK
ncbi:MAG: hypothetical protein Q4B43_08980 [Bacteroidota bacterium]|nr:hypothetical protein [Bacteroidota bacterium]